MNKKILNILLEKILQTDKCEGVGGDPSDGVAGELPREGEQGSKQGMRGLRFTMRRARAAHLTLTGGQFPIKDDEGRATPILQSPSQLARRLSYRALPLVGTAGHRDAKRLETLAQVSRVPPDGDSCFCLLLPFGHGT